VEEAKQSFFGRPTVDEVGPASEANRKSDRSGRGPEGGRADARGRSDGIL
jgi:hypothetical protein